MAFSLKKNYDLAINLLKEINYDMSKIEKAYFDPKKTLDLIKISFYLKEFSGINFKTLPL